MYVEGPVSAPPACHQYLYSSERELLTGGLVEFGAPGEKVQTVGADEGGVCC